MVLAHAICVRKRRKKKYDVALENGLASPFLHKPLLPLKDDSAPAMCRGHTAVKRTARGHTAVNRTARKPDTWHRKTGIPTRKACSCQQRQKTKTWQKSLGKELPPEGAVTKGQAEGKLEQGF